MGRISIILWRICLQYFCCSACNLCRLGYNLSTCAIHIAAPPVNFHKCHGCNKEQYHNQYISSKIFHNKTPAFFISMRRQVGFMWFCIFNSVQAILRNRMDDRKCHGGFLIQYIRWSAGCTYCHRLRVDISFRHMYRSSRLLHGKSRLFRYHRRAHNRALHRFAFDW